MIFASERIHQQLRQKNRPQPGFWKSSCCGLTPRAQRPWPYLAHAGVSVANLHHHRERGQSQLKSEEKGMNWSECFCLSGESYKYFSWEYPWKRSLKNQCNLFASEIKKFKNRVTVTCLRSQHISGITTRSLFSCLVLSASLRLIASTFMGPAFLH